MDPFTVTATATSGLPVVFSSTTATVCTVLSATVTIGAVGTCTIQAAQPGNASYTAAVAVSRSFTVGKASQTITFGALADQVVGAVPFTVSATAASGLTVVFTSSTAAVCTVSSNLVTVVTFGTCSLTATQVGNANYAAAAPVIQTFHVTEGAQTITFGALANQVFGSAPQTLTATASSGLPVGFSSTTTGICTTAAVAVTVISTGTCTIQASQPGNSNYPAALPVSQSFAVTQGAQTIQFAALANKVFGSAPFKITATASSGLTVSLDSATQGGCTVAAGLVTLVGTGTCTIQASQPGNTNYAAATPVVQSLTVATANQTITFASLGSIVFGAASPALSATASSGLAVSYASTTASTCNAADGLLTIVTAGTCTIQASQSGSANYAAALSVSQNLTVTKASQAISFSALANQGVGATPFSLTATASSGLAVVFSTATKTCTVSNGTVAVVTLLSTGTCTIAAAQPGNASFTAAASVSQSFTIALGTLSVAAVLNAGSYAAGTLAPSGYAVIFGNNLASAVAAATSAVLPTTLAGTTVSVTDSSGAKRPAQISYVSPGQVNVLFPAGLADGEGVVTIANTTGSSGVASVNIAAIAPSLFTADSSGSGPPAAYAVAYPSSGAVAPAQVLTVTSCAGSPWVCSPTPIDLSNASQNVYLALFGTGIRGRSSLAGVTVTLGGTAANVTYAGAQGSYAGLDQVNVLLGRSLMGRGLLSLQLTVDGVPANPVVIDIQ
jgi:uncharacterized protein (TIGR03437 family)